MSVATTSYRCAVCRSANFEIIQSQSLALLGKTRACQIDFSACRNCGHLQQTPPVSPELMAYHYRTFATYEMFGDPIQLRAAAPSRHAMRLLSLVSDIGLKPGTAYEIGCASGEMLNQFLKKGWTVSGCDPSHSAIDQAKNTFGIEADLGGEETVLPGRNGLDLILICHVLEHLYNPRASLRRFHDALGPEGHLVLEVPCAINPDILPPGWFTFEHLHYYRPEILAFLLQDTGFELLEMRIDTKAEHYPITTVAARKARSKSKVVPPFQPDVAVLMARAYALRDAALWRSTEKRLKPVSGPVFLYGAGIHTAQLLDRTSLTQRCEIIAVADRDSKKWGQTLDGKKIICPAELIVEGEQQPVIISSYVSEHAIVCALLEAGMAPERILTLYSDVPASLCQRSPTPSSHKYAG